jgi:hypothetical protein
MASPHHAAFLLAPTTSTPSTTHQPRGFPCPMHSRLRTMTFKTPTQSPKSHRSTTRLPSPPLLPTQAPHRFRGFPHSHRLLFAKTLDLRHLNQITHVYGSSNRVGRDFSPGAFCVFLAFNRSFGHIPDFIKLLNLPNPQPPHLPSRRSSRQHTNETKVTRAACTARNEQAHSTRTRPTKSTPIAQSQQHRTTLSMAPHPPTIPVALRS